MGETSTTSDNADDTTQMSESKQELENFLMTVKEESEKAGLKLNIIKTEIFFLNIIKTDFFFSVVSDSGRPHR